MKKLICVFLSVLMLLALAAPVCAEESSFRFTRENFPVMDGSTSMVPLGEGIASVLLGESREDAASLISFNRTTQSFRNLRDGLCDIVIAAEPNNAVFDEMAKAAFAYQLETIAKEALVFIVNENNPVDSLTAEQVRGIYSGAITNWSQVGGEDLPIEAFQRNPSSGSQVMMEKLVMDGTPMMEAPTTHIPGEMSGLIEAVRSYDNSANAIGYTVFYYAADMQMAKGLKILKIDGVLPSAESLRTETYPYINGYYACISAAAPKDSPARRLYQWLVSDEGQALLSLEGYVSVYAPGEAPSAAEIAVDYSHYVPNGGTKAQFTDKDCPKDHLEPADDYGLIYPYEGQKLYSSWNGESADYFSGAMMGFYNHKGERITDPVFTSISRCCFNYNNQQEYFWSFQDAENRTELASKDGSKVIAAQYRYAMPMNEGVVCTKDYEYGIFDFYDRDLNLVYTQDDFQLDGEPLSISDAVNGMFICQVLQPDGYYGRSVLLDSNLQVLAQAEGHINLVFEDRILLYDEDWNISMTDMEGNPILFDGDEKVTYVSILNQNFLSVQLEDGTMKVVDRNGCLFEWNFDFCRYEPDGHFMVGRGKTAVVYDSKGRIAAKNVPSDWDYISDGCIFTETRENALIVHNLSTDTTLEIPHGRYMYQIGPRYEVECSEGDSWYAVLLDKDLNMMEKPADITTECIDVFTGENYLQTFDMAGFSGEQRLYTADGSRELFRANGQVRVENGFFVVCNDTAYTCYCPDGTVLFCYPYYGFASGD